LKNNPNETKKRNTGAGPDDCAHGRTRRKKKEPKEENKGWQVLSMVGGESKRGE